MVNIHSGYQNSGEELFLRLLWSRKPRMVGVPLEEHDRDDPEARFAQLEKSIATSIILVTHILEKKDK
jgi:hypothetical protein